jgi:hypothetical protein
MYIRYLNERVVPIGCMYPLYPMMGGYIRVSCA